MMPHAWLRARAADADAGPVSRRVARLDAWPVWLPLITIQTKWYCHYGVVFYSRSGVFPASVQLDGSGHSPGANRFSTSYPLVVLGFLIYPWHL